MDEQQNEIDVVGNESVQGDSSRRKFLKATVASSAVLSSTNLENLVNGDRLLPPGTVEIKSTYNRAYCAVVGTPVGDVLYYEIPDQGIRAGLLYETIRGSVSITDQVQKGETTIAGALKYENEFHLGVIDPKKPGSKLVIPSGKNPTQVNIESVKGTDSNQPAIVAIIDHGNGMHVAYIAHKFNEASVAGETSAKKEDGSDVLKVTIDESEYEYLGKKRNVGLDYHTLGVQLEKEFVQDNTYNGISEGQTATPSTTNALLPTSGWKYKPIESLGSLSGNETICTSAAGERIAIVTTGDFLSTGNTALLNVYEMSGTSMNPISIGGIESPVLIAPDGYTVVGDPSVSINLADNSIINIVYKAKDKFGREMIMLTTFVLKDPTKPLVYDQEIPAESIDDQTSVAVGTCGLPYVAVADRDKLTVHQIAYGLHETKTIQDLPGEVKEFELVECPYGLKANIWCQKKDGSNVLVEKIIRENRLFSPQAYKS